MSGTKSDLVVYTVAMGSAYALPDVTGRDDVPYVCFTDQSELPANGWSLIKVTPVLLADTYRSSREFKARIDRYLPDFSRSIYIDTRVELIADAETVWQHLVPTEQTLFAAYYHSFRSTVRDEFAAVRSAGLDRKNVLDEQLAHYQEYYPDTLGDRPVWAGLVARRHMDPRCIAAMDLWFIHTLRYSRRVQLSLSLALATLPDGAVALHGGNNRESEIHRWPPVKGPRPKDYYVGFGLRRMMDFLRRTTTRTR